MNSAFVSQLFTVALDRSPSETELTSITDQLASGKLTRNQLSRGVLNSQESLTILVNNTYQAVNGNPPTSAQLQSGITFLASKHGSLNGLSAQIYGTAEYRTVSSITDNATFVKNVSSDAGVTLTPAKTESYIKELDRGHKTSTQVAYSILTSHKSLVGQIDVLYSSYLGTTPTAAQEASAFRVIDHAHRYGLRLALINSSDFVAQA